VPRAYDIFRAYEGMDGRKNLKKIRKVYVKKQKTSKIHFSKTKNPL
jgi:hypothetical protein